METKYTSEELERMKNYEQQIGKRMIYSFNERCQIYETKPNRLLRAGAEGIEDAISARLDSNNADSFSGLDDIWKLKVLADNLNAIKFVLRQK